ncbi:MAG: CHC2 zinc finger domain-containing protein [Bacteroidales bacterium]|jgi:DNA primase|nr:CHC2 zinc finger domain-containing protein [Bacteroidales bacterium]
MKQDIVLEKIKDVAKLEDIAGDYMQLSNAGKDLHGTCPLCGKSGKGKGMIISPAKQIFKCFSCGEGGAGALAFLQKTQNKTFVEAKNELAQKYNISEEASTNSRLNYEAKKMRKRSKKAFIDKQLKSSGLTFDDVRTTVIDGSKTKEIPPYQTGCLDDYWRLLPGEGDDMVIYYYDLEGRPVEYTRKGNKNPEQFYRIRFQNPDAHKDKSGKGMKYYSPSGSGTQLYIPEAVRKLYKSKRKIKRLFLQEGEKKAEKACKHGVMSVGLMGIHNVGSKGQMPRDLQTLIIECEVDEVCIMFDSDWQDLSRNVRVGDNVQLRPYSFFRALKSFKEYMISFRNMDIFLEVYFAAIRINETGDKGLDDLLANGLKVNPDSFKDDLEAAFNSKDGKAAHVEVHKVTSLTDFQLMNFWNLNDNREFAQKHLGILKNIPEFMIKRTKFRINENNELELAEPMLPEEKFWQPKEKGSGYIFVYPRLYTFLANRGYGRIVMLGERHFVRTQKNIVEFVDRIDIKEYVMEFIKNEATEDVQNMMYSGGHFYLGPHSLENLNTLNLDFEMAERTSQNLHFHDKFWNISIDGVKEMNPSSRTKAVYANKIHKKNVKLLKDHLLTFTQENGKYNFHVSETGKKAHFLQFLINTSNLYWRSSRHVENLLPGEQIEVATHLLSKLTALGYQCHRYFNASVAKSIIYMDAKNSEVGASNGRSGKSILGLAIGKIVPQVYVGGKSKKITDDNFLFEEVTEETENVFFDDVRANIDFEHFFPNITGRWTINKKGVGRNTLPTDKSPKIAFSTNHAINGEGSSFKDRQHVVVFSDYYNDNHKPTDDFRLLFFDEWGEDQYNYFFNLVATSLHLYFKYGLVEAPVDIIEKRRLRQQMGEDFLQWSDMYFGYNDSHIAENLNQEIPRKELYLTFLDSNRAGNVQRYYTPNRFRKSMTAFCHYKGFAFNPTQPNDEEINISDWLASDHEGAFIGLPNKSGSVEYWEISDAHLELNKPF